MTKKKPTQLAHAKLKKLKKDKRLRRYLPLFTMVLGVFIGIYLAWLQPPNLTPRNLIWGADKSVQVPGDLAEFLRLQDACQSYRGKESPRGVGLWGVYQVSQGKFAKIAYGCGFGLTRYRMAAKVDHEWKLFTSEEYFAPSGSNFLPNCGIIDQYHIDKSIEPFCVQPDGAAHENLITAVN